MMKIKEIQNSERPREKLRSLGIRSLNDAELLAILLRSGIAGKSAIQLAQELLSLCGSINNLSALDVNTLESIKGIKGVKASEVLALCEVSRRMAQQASLEVDVIDQPSRLVNWLKKELGSSQQEQFMVVFLNTKNHIIGYKILYMGGLDRSIVHPREVYKEALKVSAARIIAVHNHPSGDVSPSENDRLVTKVLEEAGDTMGIPLLDHLIVSHYGYTSLRQILKKD
jgi:DNA repair protein RadC